MALRSRSATSGPGRAPASDSRARHGRGSGSSRGPGRGSGRGPGRPVRLRGRRVSAAATTALRRRADALFEAPPRSAGTGLDAAVARSRLDEGVRTETDTRTDARRRAGLALRERLPLWVQLRCGLEPRTLAALAVVLVVAGVFAAQYFWVGRPQSVRAPELVQQSAATPEPQPQPSPGVPPAPSDAGAGGPGGRIVVDVSGKVRRPGGLQLPAGSRVADALRAAGGVRAGTDLTGLNRARVLVDGEQVVVGGPAPPGPVASGSGAGGSGTGGGAQAAGPVSLNAATVEQLDTLPGVGPVLAQHIIDYRTQHGGFRSVGELREVNGIGDRRFAELQTRVRP
ncbi:helix-hairpin-helix domain-containing protein [Streptomyces lunaelactis]|uniref:helix-hairpin-helix domain-containing protein n=1 Tax=Streptomyces lunaelactis TaxID=1535768 RepID=UPI0015858D13|nr:ComEA family DNA-binding protein [Streptomyces lunaelactis]